MPLTSLKLARVMLAVALLVAGGGSAAAKKPGESIISPAGLGPRYSGYTGAGLGVSQKAPQFGVRAGDFVIQPRFFLEAAYSTNFFRVDERTNIEGRDTEQIGVFELRLRPGVGIYNPKFTLVSVNLSLDADVWLPLVSTGTGDVTSLATVGGVASADVAFFPKGILTLKIAERFERELWTRATSVSGEGNANRFTNRLGADVSFHPGGRALDITAGYRWGIIRYDQIEDLDRDSHSVRLLASWRFFPLTYAFLESTVAVSEYPNRPDQASGVAGNYRSGIPFKVFLGMSGYLTDRFALLIRAGYGNSFLDEQGGVDDNFSSFIGMVQASFRFTGRTALHVGVARDFDMAAFGGYQDYVRAWLSFEQRIGDLLQIHIDGAFDYRWYGVWNPYPYTVTSGGSEVTVTPTVSASEREDMRVQAGILLDFNLHRLFGISVGYRLDYVISDYNLVMNLPTGTATQFYGYDDHRVFVSLNLRY